MLRRCCGYNKTYWSPKILNFNRLLTTLQCCLCSTFPLRQWCTTLGTKCWIKCQKVCSFWVKICKTDKRTYRVAYIGMLLFYFIWIHVNLILCGEICYGLVLLALHFYIFVYTNCWLSPQQTLVPFYDWWVVS